MQSMGPTLAEKNRLLLWEADLGVAEYCLLVALQIGRNHPSSSNGYISHVHFETNFQNFKRSLQESLDSVHSASKGELPLTALKDYLCDFAIVKISTLYYKGYHNETTEGNNSDAMKKYRENILTDFEKKYQSMKGEIDFFQNLHNVRSSCIAHNDANYSNPSYEEHDKGYIYTYTSSSGLTDKQITDVLFIISFIQNHIKNQLFAPTNHTDNGADNSDNNGMGVN